jgi:hypothetical protein
MRTTIRIDDELFERLKREAQRQNLSLTRLVNRLIKAGLAAPPVQQKRTYKQRVHAMGVPKVPLDKALALAGRLEDDEILRKLVAGK